MKPIERIKRMLNELENDGARFCFTKQGKSYFLTYKDNMSSKADFRRGLIEIEKFLCDKCCSLDSRTGIIF